MLGRRGTRAIGEEPGLAGTTDRMRDSGRETNNKLGRLGSTRSKMPKVKAYSLFAVVKSNERSNKVSERGLRTLYEATVRTPLLTISGVLVSKLPGTPFHPFGDLEVWEGGVCNHPTNESRALKNVGRKHFIEAKLVENSSGAWNLMGRSVGISESSGW